MVDWNSYLSERPHRVYPGPEVFYEYQYVHANIEESCWHLKDTVTDWMHEHIRGCWVLWEDHRYMNNMDLYEDCSSMEDCHRHTRPFIAFQNAEDAMIFKLTW
jgi:hypothetical protein